MKHIMIFTLPDDRDELTLAEHGSKYWSALWELQQRLREKVKYGKVQKTTWEEVQDLFYAVLDEEDVDLEEVT